MRPTELVGAAHQEVTVQVLNQSPALSLVGISRDTALSLVRISRDNVLSLVEITLGSYRQGWSFMS